MKRKNTGSQYVDMVQPQVFMPAAQPSANVVVAPEIVGPSSVPRPPSSNGDILYLPQSNATIIRTTDPQIINRET